MEKMHKSPRFITEADISISYEPEQAEISRELISRLDDGVVLFRRLADALSTVSLPGAVPQACAREIAAALTALPLAFRDIVELLPGDQEY